MVLFIYTTSLASNEKFDFYPTSIVTMVYATAATLIIILTYSTINFWNTLVKINVTKTHLSLLFSTQITFLVIFTITYLLFTLIVVVKITTIWNGPLRRIIKK